MGSFHDAHVSATVPSSICMLITRKLVLAQIQYCPETNFSVLYWIRHRNWFQKEASCKIMLCFLPLHFCFFSSALLSAGFSATCSYFRLNVEPWPNLDWTEVYRNWPISRKAGYKRSHFSFWFDYYWVICSSTASICWAIMCFKFHMVSFSSLTFSVRLPPHLLCPTFH